VNATNPEWQLLWTQTLNRHLRHKNAGVRPCKLSHISIKVCLDGAARQERREVAQLLQLAALFGVQELGEVGEAQVGGAPGRGVVSHLHCPIL